MTFMAAIFLSAMGDSDNGLVAQFRDNKPALAIRMEKQMTVGRCFEIQKGGGTPCQGRLWRGPAPL
jgi:hypothetical protein